jgi:tetratricopeptide (TPR) repeat protein
LRFDQARPGRGSRAALAIWLVLMAAAVGVIWRFDSAQDWVRSHLGAAPTATPDALDWAQQGERAYLAGDLDSAISHYAQAAALAPGDISITFEYGRSLIYRSYAGRRYTVRAEEALALAQNTASRAPENAQAQALLCWALVANGQAQEAIGAGLRAVELAPDYGAAWAYLALAYQESGRAPSFMLDAAQKAVTYSPDSLDARWSLALALTSMGNFSAAIQEYERAIQLHPRLDLLYFELAACYKAQQNYEAAIRAYDQILVLEPDNVKAYTRLCETNFNIGEWAQAQEACEQAALLDPTYSEAFQELGKVRYKRRNFEGAVEALQTCADLEITQGIDPDARAIECTYIRGLALLYLDRCAEAWPLLQEAITMNPTEDEARSITQGLEECADYSAGRDPSVIATPTPAPTLPAEIIPVY